MNQITPRRVLVQTGTETLDPDIVAWIDVLAERLNPATSQRTETTSAPADRRHWSMRPSLSEGELGDADLLILAEPTSARLRRAWDEIGDVPCPIITLTRPSADDPNAPVVIPLDGTDVSYDIADWASAFAAATGHPLHGVIATNPMYDTFDNAGDYGDDERRARLEALAEHAQVHERAGHLAEVLSAVATELEAYAVVVGRPDSTGLHRIGHGHPIDDVIASAHSPVIVIPTDRERTSREVVTGSDIDHELTAEQLEELTGAKTVLTLTDDHHDPSLSHERNLAARVAGQLGARLVLLDRGASTWLESPHVESPLNGDELRRQGRHELAHQVDEAQHLGARDVSVIAPSAPTFDAIRDAVEAVDADVIVVPPHLDHPHLAERWQHHGDVVVAVKELVGDRHIVVTAARPRVI